MKCMGDRVIFRTWRGRDKTGDDVIALFPDTFGNPEICNPGRMLSYEHVGQHGEADYQTVLRGTRPAKPSEFISLKRELRRIGYHPVTVKRFDRRRGKGDRDDRKTDSGTP